ncbi:hypothetical protein [Chroococcidiopsis cubana]|uniref:hypothetical protein n=1 Tax=Chroococcidiopsis cubana TaxID=171392 RepID=UPI002ACEBD24|nr:hypothetical protein [Chroococcidiopsis cubana]
MHCGCVTSIQKQVEKRSHDRGEVTMLKQVLFFSTLAGFGFLLGVISGAIV